MPSPGDLGQRELDALCTPVARRTEAQVDTLVKLMHQTGFPVKPGDEAPAREMCRTFMLEELDEGDVLFVEDSEGSDIYLVLSGSMVVTKKSVRKPINTVGVGEFFGQMALLHSDPIRHSTIAAGEDTLLARMDAAELVRCKVDLELFKHAENHYKDLRAAHDADAAEKSGALDHVSPAVKRVMHIAKMDPEDRTVADLDLMLDVMKNFSIFSQEKEFLKNLGQRRAVAAVLHCRTYEPDRVICTEGERGDSMFIVLYGRLSVSHIEKVRTPLVLSIRCLSLSRPVAHTSLWGHIEGIALNGVEARRCPELVWIMG